LTIELDFINFVVLPMRYNVQCCLLICSVEKVLFIFKSIILFFNLQIQVPMSLILFVTDTESARASREQYGDTLYSVLFDMNVPAVCAVDLVCILTSALILNQLYTYL
jgi:hypothetical protein